MLNGKGKKKGEPVDNILNCWGWKPCIPKEFIMIWIIITLIFFAIMHFISKNNPYKNDVINESKSNMINNILSETASIEDSKRYSMMLQDDALKDPS